MNIKNIALLCSLLCINACKSYQNTPNKMSKLVCSSIVIDSTKLRYDGMYNVFDTSFVLLTGDISDKVYVTTREVVFLKSGKIHRNGGVNLDSLIFGNDMWILIGTELKHSLGEYLIIGDSIYAYTPSRMSLGGGRFKSFNANFSGYIKNKDTILNWRMIPPYPDVDPTLNNYFVNDTTPRTLYFIKNDAVKCLDSLLAQ